MLLSCCLYFNITEDNSNKLWDASEQHNPLFRLHLRIQNTELIYSFFRCHQLTIRTVRLSLCISQFNQGSSSALSYTLVILVTTAVLL